MKYKMQSLKHNGIYVPTYEPKGFSVRIQGTRIKLSPRTEQMAVFWVKKEQSKTTPPDRLFYKNFMEDFLEALKLENPSLEVLENLQIRTDVDPLNDGKPRADMEVDFSEIRQYVLQEQLDKQNMTKEEKKRLAQERKTKREKLKEHYGYAAVDGKKIEIANWTAEPSCIFAGRGDHPRRGKWKEGPKEGDIVLNLSPDGPRPFGNWKETVWQPEMMYIASWRDKLGGEMKYVWFSDSAFLKQNREKEKFDKADKLEDKVPRISEHIMKNLDDKDEERRKIATVCWLILEVNLRVGDEKDPGEADTVGAITLRPEHIRIEGNTLHFDFLGKDAVRWLKDVEAPTSVIENIKHLCETCKEYLFEGIDSKKVSRFLNEKMEGLTAKVFRTWKVSKTVRKCLEKNRVKKEDPDYAKLYEAKLANLEAAKIANHKRKVPLNFDERLAKKEAKLKDIESQLREKEAQGKKTESLVKRLDKARIDLELTKETREYNLGTSLKSYIDPRVYVEWANEVEFCIDKFYTKTLRNKYSWAIKQCKFLSAKAD
jgi:DNA topoisomerase-1